MTGPILEFRALATARAATEIRWIPGHNNITGNNQHTFANQFATSFLDFWRQSLSILPPVTAPTYSSVAAGRSPLQAPGGNATPSAGAPPPAPQQRADLRLQGRPIPAPPKEDLRVFVRLDAEAPARKLESYAIRTHIAAKVGIDLHQIPAAFPVNSGWAVRTTDSATRDLIVQRQSEWAQDLGANIVETSRKWYTYVVANCPRRLTDLQGNEADYDEAVRGEITCQTGLSAVSIRPSRHDSNDLPRTACGKWENSYSPSEHDRPNRMNQGPNEARDRKKRRRPYLSKSSPKMQARTPATNRKAAPCHLRARLSQLMARNRSAENQLHNVTVEEEALQPRQPLHIITMRRHHNSQTGRKTIRVFQANVGKIPPAHDCALALADAEQYDVVLLQEPWTEAKEGRCLTKTHPAYDTFSPVDSWTNSSTRPRVMTYVRRRPGLTADQRRAATTRDILWLTINIVTIVNCYRQPDFDEALDILLAWRPPSRCLVAGDFNAKHYSWQSGRLDGRGDDIAYWAAESGLSLLNPADVPTNPHGNTIDLAFSNMPLSEAVVEDHLATSSDHFTLSLTLPDVGVTPLAPQKVRLTTEDEINRFVELVQYGSADIPTLTTTTHNLDVLASALVRLLQVAAKVAGRPVRKQTRSAPWWTEECRLAAAEYRAIRRVYPLGFCREVQLAKKDFQKVVRQAKRLYWRNLIDSFTDTEVQDATIRTGKTSPGSDNITVKMLKAAWHIIGEHVRRLYEGCLRLGHHPQPFREAEVVMIAKPGRRNLSTARAWRPISLLSCLGKGLERLIARRLAWASIHYGVLHPQQAGALPKRSAVDLVAALVHDIEEAFARGQVATLVTMDIQGAFDTVLRNRLILRLRQQGWPEHLARWAGSFMSDRSACVRYQDITTPSSPLQCGLPQGSPVSPILFLLYTEPIYRLGDPKGRFGYADDTGILCVGHSLETTADRASRHVSELVTWGAANGISFDPAKTEVMHFCRTKPKVSPPVFHEGERRPDKTMRWLGIWLDSTLTFKTHVEKWTAKAQAVAHHLQGLANTKHGPLPSAMRRAVQACVEPVLLHGAEAWYPGLTSPRWSQPTKEGSSGIQQLLRKMNKSLHNSMRAVLPVWRTTPIAALHRESGILPIVQLPETRRMCFAARLKAVDEAHSLAKRTLQPSPPAIHRSIKLKYRAPREGFRTRLRRSDKLLPRSTRPLLLPRRFDEHATPLRPRRKTTAEDSRVWLRSIPCEMLVIYSDGSLSTEKAAGYGYVIHCSGLTLTSGSGRLGPAEVFDAEAKGAFEGLRAALGLAGPRQIVACFDKLAVATCLRGMPANSSQAVFLEFQALATAHGAVEVRWIPGHTNIAGNEQADALAKAATSLPEPADVLPTLAHLRRTARQQPRDAFEAWWDASAPDQYKPLHLKPTTGCPQS
ncbi:endonuclease/reverse transcriptase [Purpureocillium lilacinum]|uniref:Endonuclease/reverse transcriptase n=1 Tax=Purpureocillium lilacinum TaxID=33203 RepID=A0A179FFE4_PURLI|nr:endonuclease/reverse transcriptase [Purpureocillium lilacinum]OAQ63773.1 endonuclease/reverse transcriptase [Purpureocillium lilacinum]